MAFRKSQKDAKKLKNYIASARRTATIARNLGKDVIFEDARNLNSFRDRKEFNKYINSIKKFNRENRYYKNEKGVIFKTKDIKLANELIKKENKIRRKQKKEINNLKQTIGGEYNNIKLNKALRVVKDERESIFEKVKNVNIESYTSEKQLKNRIKSLKRNTRNPDLRKKRLRDNYVKSLRNKRKEGILTSSAYKEMKSNIDKLDLNQFMKWFYQEQSSIDNFVLGSPVVSFMETELKDSLKEINKSLSKFVKRNAN